ncbi:LemA family protein [Urinicoccus massiliensis]|uniref:LemA family protein n=1 Tax=Urinicoccus massiliensis TaxID=1723382 RepID=UPI0009F8EBE6|nr:LemA family protein [Urinicoccus massiliensis]
MNRSWIYSLVLFIWIGGIFAVMEGIALDKYISLNFLPVVLVILVGVFFIKKVNKLKRYRIIITESKKNVDIALAKRYDTISQMLKLAKSFANYEKATFSDLVKLRQGSSIGEFNQAIQDQDQAIGKIYALAEAYPDLRSSEEFLHLQKEIDDENEQLAAAKRIVNSNISIFNQEVVSFPTSIIAGISGLREIDFLKEDKIDQKKSLEDFDYEVKA